MRNVKKISCPHCQSNDTTVLKLLSNTCYVTVLGQKGRKDHSIIPHICLDCGMIFVPAEKLQAIKKTRDTGAG